MLKIIAAIALLATTAPAIAQPDATTRTVHVSYADLDLRQAADVKQLDHRIRAALRAVCPGGAAADVPANFAALNCRKAAYVALANQRTAALAKAAGTTQLALNAAAR